MSSSNAASETRHVFLLGAGSFNPPTIMHMRMFDIARDHLTSLQSCPHQVLGGVISPVHDAYAKPGLLPSRHRVEMLRLTLADNPMLKLSRWESDREQWTPTRQVLEAHRDALREYTDGSSSRPPWVPESCSKEILKESRLYLICGMDLLESFNTPGLWDPEDILKIVRDYGLVVLSRGGSEFMELIYKSDTLNQYKENIFFALSDMGSDISSTKIRLAVRRGRSIRHLVHESVIRYIGDNGLYRAAEYDEAEPTDIFPSHCNGVLQNNNDNKNKNYVSDVDTNGHCRCDMKIVPRLPPIDGDVSSPAGCFCGDENVVTKENGILKNGVTIGENSDEKQQKSVQIHITAKGRVRVLGEKESYL